MALHAALHKQSAGKGLSSFRSAHQFSNCTHRTLILSHAQKNASPRASEEQKESFAYGTDLVGTSFGLYLLSSLPAMADVATMETSIMQNSQSLMVTGALFLMCVPGIWSQVKRAPTAKKVRKVFEVEGPAKPDAVKTDDRARQIFRYFKSYNYEVKGTGDVIVFSGTYAPDKGQAAAVTFYTFCGMASVALVLSTIFPTIGGWWYALTGVSPLAYFYYNQRAERVEEVRVKMVTSDDEQTTDITIEGDTEEIERFRKELKLMEKGKVYVKGLFEQE